MRLHNISRSVNIKAEFICFVKGFGDVGIPNVRALGRPCQLMLYWCVSSIVSRRCQFKESLVILVCRDCAISQSYLTASSLYPPQLLDRIDCILEIDHLRVIRGLFVRRL
jgi:hypothetical protein